MIAPLRFQPGRAQEMTSSSTNSLPNVTRPSVPMSPQTPPVNPSSPGRVSSSHSDKIRPISKASSRPTAVTPTQSPSKSSSVASSINTDVPHIEINSPSPNSPSVTPTSNKSKVATRETFDQTTSQQQRFGYDSYIKQQQEEATSHIKSPNSQRKTGKTSTATTISPVKQRDYPDSKRSNATPLNGNPAMVKNKASSARHASSSSEEQQHTAPPTPMRPMPLKEQQPTQQLTPAPPPQAQQTPLVNSHLINKTNQPSRLFIALFNYDPNAMSPNKDNEEELPFKESQLIRVRIDRLISLK